MNLTHTNSTSVPDNSYLIATQACIIIFQALNFLIGLPLNCYIIRLLVSKPGGPDVSVVFPLNQSAGDIIYCLVAPLYMSCIISLNYCVGPLLGLWLGTCMLSRCLFQCWVCLERYLAVIHPVTFLRFKPLRYRVGCSVVAWLLALALGLASMCTFPVMPYDAFGAVYLLIFTLDSFCCVSILKGLLSPAPGDRDDRDMNVAKKKAFQVVSMNLLTFLVQIVPIVVSFGLLSVLSPESFHLGVGLSMSIFTIAGYVHPIFILHKAGKI